MSNINSSADHLTLNADGTGKSIKFQCNNVEKASIDSSGNFTSTSIDATKLSGALPAIDGSALTGLGKVLQVKIVEDSSEMTLSSSTYTDTNLILSITPSSTSSKILVLWNVQAGINSQDGGWGTQLVRGATNIYTSGSQYDCYSSTNGAHIRMRGDYKHLDSPNTTSAVTYKVQVGSYTNLAIRFNNASNQTQLVLMEIGV